MCVSVCGEENEKSLNTGFTILKYAVMQNNRKCVRKLLRDSRENMSSRKRAKFVESSMCRDLLAYASGVRGVRVWCSSLVFENF